MNQRKTAIIVIAAVAFLAVLVAWNSFTYTIQTGEKGVIFRKFQGGLDEETVYPQGFHFKLPWDEVFIYNVQLQESRTTMEVLSKNGLTIGAELSYRYHPDEDRIGFLHNNVGVNYHDKIIIPEIRSATREVIGKYLPDELYSTKREAIQSEIEERTAEALKRNDLFLDAILIRDIQLPPKLKAAIERKLEQEQSSLEYQYRLDKALKEAERQRIEAEGKAVANKIISSSLTDKILKEKGIEATLELAKSPNSKTVIIGSGKDGLPIILGDK